MSDIYSPGGRANEYCKLALNLYLGCNHACLYCYAPSTMKKKREQYQCVTPTKGTIENIQKSAKRYKGQEVLLCFLTDPYNELDQTMQQTRKALQIFKDNGVVPVILTKAGMKSMRDFDLLDSNSKYGATLTFINDADSLTWEPGAALPGNRFKALQEAKSRGIQTWASLEPVIDPAQTLEIIRRTHDFVDHYKVGKWNGDKRASLIDWSVFAHDVLDLFEKYKKSYYIKESLRGYATRRKCCA